MVVEFCELHTKAGNMDSYKILLSTVHGTVLPYISSKSSASTIVASSRAKKSPASPISASSSHSQPLSKPESSKESSKSDPSSAGAGAAP